MGGDFRWRGTPREFYLNITSCTRIDLRDSPNRHAIVCQAVTRAERNAEHRNAEKTAVHLMSSSRFVFNGGDNESHQSLQQSDHRGELHLSTGSLKRHPL